MQSGSCECSQAAGSMAPRSQMTRQSLRQVSASRKKVWNCTLGILYNNFGYQSEAAGVIGRSRSECKRLGAEKRRKCSLRDDWQYTQGRSSQSRGRLIPQDWSGRAERGGSSHVLDVQLRLDEAVLEAKDLLRAQFRERHSASAKTQFQTRNDRQTSNSPNSQSPQELYEAKNRKLTWRGWWRSRGRCTLSSPATRRTSTVAPAP